MVYHVSGQDEDQIREQLENDGNLVRICPALRFLYPVTDQISLDVIFHIHFSAKDEGLRVYAQFRVLRRIFSNYLSYGGVSSHEVR